MIQSNGRLKKDSVSIQVDQKFVRLLGIKIDHRLIFRQYVEIWCAKALDIANHMQKLNPVNHGADAVTPVEAV